MTDQYVQRVDELIQQRKAIKEKQRKLAEQNPDYELERKRIVNDMLVRERLENERLQCAKFVRCQVHFLLNHKCMQNRPDFAVVRNPFADDEGTVTVPAVLKKSPFGAVQVSVFAEDGRLLDFYPQSIATAVDLPHIEVAEFDFNARVLMHNDQWVLDNQLALRNLVESEVMKRGFCTLICDWPTVKAVGNYSPVAQDIPCKIELRFRRIKL
jgi:hypothetical protein